MLYSLAGMPAAVGYRGAQRLSIYLLDRSEHRTTGYLIRRNPSRVSWRLSVCLAPLQLYNTAVLSGCWKISGTAVQVHHSVLCGVAVVYPNHLIQQYQLLPHSRTLSHFHTFGPVASADRAEWLLFIRSLYPRCNIFLGGRR